MKPTLLVTRPDYDVATGYLFYYAKEIIDFAEKKNIKVLDLVRPRLTRDGFSELVSKEDPGLLFFNAHGDDKTIYGDKIKGVEEPLIEEGKNHHLLNGRITYARACCTAASLGKACTGKEGCFIGYNAPFSFWFNEKWSAKPSNDNIAKLFLEPSNLIVLSLLKGNTALEAVDKSANMTNKSIMRLLRSKEEPGTMASMMILWNNSQSLDILGEKDIRFV